LEILDLSHPEISKLSVAMVVSGVVCLVSLARGGIKVSAGEIEEYRRRSLVFAMEVFWREKEQERDAAKGITGGGRRLFIVSQ
jgi:hypothetical protein